MFFRFFLVDARQAESASTPDALAEAKQLANVAASEAHQARNEAAATVERLQNKNRALDKALNEAYKIAREAKAQDKQPKESEERRQGK